MAHIPYQAEDYVGGAPQAVLSGTITNAVTTINVSGTTTGWGTLGAAGGFVLALDYQTTNEEKVWVPSGTYSWNNPVVALTSVQRGYDGTSAVTHPDGANVVHVLAATDLSEANDLVYNAWGNHTGGLTLSGTLTAVSGINSTRITKRVLLISGSSNGTPTYNTDLYDVLHIRDQYVAITSFTSSGTGTPVDPDTFRISVMSTVSGIPLTFGSNFEASTVALPTTTVSGVRLDMGFFWNTETSKWRLVAVA